VEKCDTPAATVLSKNGDLRILGPMAMENDI